MSPPLTPLERDVAELVGRQMMTAPQAAATLNTTAKAVEESARRAAAKLCPGQPKPMRALIAHFRKAA